jgi:hypothetical protein
MALDSTGSHVVLDAAHIRLVVEEHEQRVLPMLETLWTCYRNPSTLGSGGSGSGGGERGGRRLRQALEAGLPRRVRNSDAHGNPREIVIENDIAWRIHTMVDFVAGKAMAIRSLAAESAVRAELDAFLSRVFEHSGGMAMVQDATLLAHVFGHVDFIVRADVAAMRARKASGLVASLADVADLIRIEPIDPRRGVAVLDEADYRWICGYVIRAGVKRDGRDGGSGSGDDAVRGRVGSLVERLAEALSKRRGTREEAEYVETVTAEASVLRVNGRATRTASNAWAGGRVPIVHVQNVAQPFAYAGLSDVEPLLPLVDELNTRLSDRANRVALQSFKMYLAKGIDGFEKAPIAPGMVWSTNNPDASIEAFGGDSEAPSEATHITEIREALDKVSGVPPLASGVVRAKLGNLTSATALRITLMGLIARTQRKRLLLGRGIAEMCDLALGAVEHAGLVELVPADRLVRVEWPDPVPVETERPGLEAGAGNGAGEARVQGAAGDLGAAEELGTDASEV